MFQHRARDNSWRETKLARASAHGLWAELAFGMKQESLHEFMGLETIFVANKKFGTSVFVPHPLDWKGEKKQGLSVFHKARTRAN